MLVRGSFSLTRLARLALFGVAILAWPVCAGTPAHAVAAPAENANANFGPFTLKVEIEGVTQGVFASVEGLGSSSEVLPAVRDTGASRGQAPGGR